MHGLNTINGHQQPRDQEHIQCVGEASADLNHSSWMTHSMKPWIGTTTGVTEQSGAKQIEQRVK